MRRALPVLGGLSILSSSFAQKLPWMPTDPGPARVAVSPEAIHLANRALGVDFDRASGGMTLKSPWSRDSFKLETPWELLFADGSKLSASALKAVEHKANLENNDVDVVQELDDASEHLHVVWKIDLHHGDHFVRQELTLSAAGGDSQVSKIQFGRGLDLAAKTGKVQGSPVTVGSYFTGLEHPMSQASVLPNGAWSLTMERKLPISSGQSVTYSSVIGVAPKGQMRRAFLAYLEEERPRRYEPFLHYNSWYDLGYFNRYTADQCVDRIKTFGDELANKRGVKLRSFLFDDGWDDPKTVWKFHKGFPDGFTPLKEAAESFGADPGVWLSPWGGYAEPREQRLTAGKAAGMEIDSEGYALSGPKYYDLFHQVCMDFVQKYGINQFKFDGTGSPDKQYPGSKFASDFEAAIALIHDLREARPGLFVNLTTGTWPSPFWTRYADSIWRGGSDHSFDGVGPWREKWITYKDGDTYHNIVKADSYYPLNSLMLHGLIYAQYAQHLKDDPSNSFRHEIRCYFGNGTQLQEMYITPSLLSTQNWDDIAQSAKWSYANRDTLVDTHWVGGDPSALSVYGWASWSPKKAILTLRNPSDKPQAFSVDVKKVFELPDGVRGTWSAKSPYADEPDSVELPVGKSKVFVLQPFEVKVLEGEVK